MKRNEFLVPDGAGLDRKLKAFQTAKLKEETAKVARLTAAQHILDTEGVSGNVESGTRHFLGKKLKVTVEVEVARRVKDEEAFRREAGDFADYLLVPKYQFSQAAANALRTAIEAKVVAREKGAKEQLDKLNKLLAKHVEVVEYAPSLKVSSRS